jgi:peptidoglycan/xylan/chitin deacetylase (PgdA/CDA1 family)
MTPPAPLRQLASVTPTTFATAVQSTLQTGHGWTAFGNAAGDLNYTGDHYTGTQCIKLTTDGGGSNEAKAQSPRVTAFDMTAKSLLLWLKVDAASYANFRYIFLQLGSGASAFAKYSRGYLDLQPDYGKASHFIPGEWTPILVTPATMMSADTGVDYTAVRDIQVKIIDNAGGACTVLVGGAYLVAKDPDYPHGVVSLTFDDGYQSIYDTAKPLMDAKGYDGAMYVIKDLVGSGGAYITKASLDGLRAAGWEVGAHAYAQANHDQANGFQGLAEATVTADFISMHSWLVANSYAPWSFAYPHGSFDRALLTLTHQYWSYGRGANTASIESLPVADSDRLRVRQPGKTTAIAPNSTIGTLEWLVDQTYTSGGWLILCLHSIVTTPVADTDVSTANFSTLIDYIAAKGVPVQTPAAVLGVPLVGHTTAVGRHPALRLIRGLL